MANCRNVLYDLCFNKWDRESHVAALCWCTWLSIFYCLTNTKHANIVYAATAGLNWAQHVWQNANLPSFTLPTFLPLLSCPSGSSSLACTCWPVIGLALCACEFISGIFLLVRLNVITLEEGRQMRAERNSCSSLLTPPHTHTHTRTWIMLVINHTHTYRVR